MKKKIFSSLLLVVFALASTSMFVSCKDYDDDINKNANAISALEKTIQKLETQTLPGLYLKIADAQSTYATIAAMNQKANITDLLDYAKLTDLKDWALRSELDNYLKLADVKDWALRSELEAYVLKNSPEFLALQEWVKDVESAKYLEGLIQDLKEFNDENKGGYLKADDEDFIKLVNFINGYDQTLGEILTDYVTSEGLNGRLNPIESAFKNLDMQEGIIKSYFDKIDEIYGKDFLSAEDKAALQDVKDGKFLKKDELFSELPTQLKDFTNDDLDKLKEIMEWYAVEVTKEDGPNLNTVQYMIDSKLMSLVFYPEYYLNGIETIEIPVLAYQPVITKKGEKKGEHFEYYANAIYGSLQTEDGIAELDPSELYTLSICKTTFEENKWALVGAWADKFSKNKDLKYTYATAPMYGTAKYHFNPTTANIDGMGLSFLAHQPFAIEALAAPMDIQGKTEANDVELTGYPTVAASNRYVPSVEKASASMIKNGLLEVKIGFKNHAAFEGYVEQLVKQADLLTGTNSDYNYTAAKFQTNIDVVALQMTSDGAADAEGGVKTRNVVSDYAAVCPTIYHVRHIVDVAPTKTWLSSEDPETDARFATTMPKCDLTDVMKSWWTNDYAPNMGSEDIRPLFLQAKNAIGERETVKDKDGNDYTRPNVPATHFIYYKDTLDIRQFIRTHFTYIAPQSTLRDEFLHKQEKTAEDDDALLKKLGLHYEYFLVPYAEGTNVTEETNHLEQIPVEGKDLALSSFFAPRNVDVNTGETIKGKEASRYAIDREPLIRVELKTEGGETIEAGYIKLLISEQKAQVIRKPVIIPHDFVGPYPMDCGMADSMFWHQIENKVLNAKKYKEQDVVVFDFTKYEFDKYFEPDTDADGNFKRYIVTHVDGEVSAVAPETNPLGVVTQKIDIMHKETSVVKWEVADPQEAIDRLGVIDNADKTLKLNEKANTTYIRFKDKTGLFGDVYLELTIKKESMQYAVGYVLNKTLSYWYQQNSGVGALDSDPATHFETHMNVPTPKDQTTVLTTDDFKKDLYEFFYNPIKDDESKAMADRIAHNILEWKASDVEFKNLSKHGTFKLIRPNDKNARVLNTNGWTVKGYSGDQYKLDVTDVTVNADGSTVQYITATKGGKTENIVSLTYTPDDPATNAKLTDNEEKSVLKLEKSEFGYDIMNKVGHKELTEEDETFTAFIEVVNEDACYSFIENPYFNVRFLRPINWYPKNPNDLKDAWNAKQTIKLSEFVSFNDWRTTDNTLSNPSTNYTGNSYPVLNTITGIFNGENTAYKYYGITITSNDQECVTDLNKGKDARIQLVGDAAINSAIQNGELKKCYVFDGFDFTFDGVDTYTYWNNEGNLGTFHIYVPLYIKYTYSPWATEPLFIKTWSSVLVKETVNNPQSAKKN